MMVICLIGIAVVCATLIWPINRWVMHNSGRSEAYGFWLSLSAAFVSGCAALILAQSLRQPIVWATGAMMGFAFASGYCLVVMYCLRIGPVGPTVAINNMGLVWPIVLGALCVKPHPRGGATTARWAIPGRASLGCGASAPFCACPGHMLPGRVLASSVPAGSPQ